MTMGQSADASSPAETLPRRETAARPPRGDEPWGGASSGPSTSSAPSEQTPGAASSKRRKPRRSQSRRSLRSGASSFGASWRDLMSTLRKGPGERKKETWWDKLQFLNVEIPLWIRKHITFYRLHATCYVIYITFATLVIYLSPSGPLGSIAFIDALYLATSACCAVGLIPVYVQQLTTFEQVFVMFLIMFGSQVFTSLIPVLVRRYYFHKYLVQEGIREQESWAEASLAGGLEDRMKELEDELGDLGSLEIDQSVRSFTAFRRRIEEDSRKSAAEGSQDNPSSTTDDRYTQDGDSRLLSRGLTTPDASSETPRAESLRLGQMSPAIADQELVPAPDNGSLRRARSIAKMPGPGDLAAGNTSSRRGQMPSPAPSLGLGSTSMRRTFSGANLSNADASNATPQVRGQPSIFFPPGMDADTMYDRSNQTWAGETAQLNARRLKALLEAARQLESNQMGATPMLHRKGSAISLTADGKSSVEAVPLLPGERRFNELRALRLLSWLVPSYMLGIILTAFLGLFLTLRFWNYYLEILDANWTNPTFMAAFQATSGFTNSGFSLFDNNLINFQQNVPYLTIVACLILLGNTMYAPTLRFILIIMNRFGSEDLKSVTRYLLDHPRKCFTHLFPAKDTLWLVITVIVFNSTEFICFCALDWTSPALDGLNSGTKILAGLFQSVATRNSGFNVIPLALLTGAMQVLYVGMMYIAVYPVYVTRQRSREQREVYDDEDIGVFYEDLEYGVLDKSVLAQGKRLIGRDSVTLFIAIFIICIIQRQEIQDDPVNFSIFNIVFEVVSAYGNVGMSLGFSCPANAVDCVAPPYSFSGVWKTGGKVMIVLIMFLGRHRGLPDNIDAAIVIPGEKQFRKTRPPSQPGETVMLVQQVSNAVK